MGQWSGRRKKSCPSSEIRSRWLRRWFFTHRVSGRSQDSSLRVRSLVPSSFSRGRSFQRRRSSTTSRHLEAISTSDIQEQLTGFGCVRFPTSGHKPLNTGSRHRVTSSCGSRRRRPPLASSTFSERADEGERETARSFDSERLHALHAAEKPSERTQEPEVTGAASLDPRCRISPHPLVETSRRSISRRFNLTGGRLDRGEALQAHSFSTT
jgi:hypothetical protein